MGAYGSIMPRYAFPGATLSAAGRTASVRRARRTIGAAGDVRSCSSSADRRQSARTAARLPAITASAFASRCLRRRRRATAVSLRASHAR